MAIRPERLDSLALSAYYDERMVNGPATANGEESTVSKRQKVGGAFRF